MISLTKSFSKKRKKKKKKDEKEEQKEKERRLKGMKNLSAIDVAYLVETVPDLVSLHQFQSTKGR